MKAVIALLLASTSVSAIQLRNYQQETKPDDFGMTPTGTIYTST